MVEHIKYKGKEYPIRVSYRVMKHFQKDTGKSLTQIDESEDIEVYEVIAYHSLLAGAKAEDVEMPLKRDDMEDFLDECFNDFVEAMAKFFPEQSQTQELTGTQATPKKKPKK
jgi:hypothetical protein